MKKTILVILVFCLSVFSLVIGIVLFSSGGNRLEIIPGSIVIGLGIWGLEWSLKNFFISISKIFRSSEEEVKKIYEKN